MDDSSNIYSFLNDIHKYFYYSMYLKTKEIFFYFYSIILFIFFLEYFIIFDTNIKNFASSFILPNHLTNM